MVLKYSILFLFIMTNMLIYFVLPLRVSFSRNRRLKTTNFVKKSLSVRKILLSGKVTFFSKLDIFNCRLQLSETLKGKTKYMSILGIIRRNSMVYLRTIGQKLNRPSPFIWTAFLNVTIVTWLYNSPMKRPRNMKFGVYLV